MRWTTASASVVVAVGGAVAVVAALHRREPGALARDVAERDVRERADEHRVVLGQRVALALVQADDERAARAAPERLRVGLVDDADHEVRVVGGLASRKDRLARARSEGG